MSSRLTFYLTNYLLLMFDENEQKKTGKYHYGLFLSATPPLRLAHPPARPLSSQVQSYVDAAGAAVRGRVRFFSA
jgi:hypothetical protein